MTADAGVMPGARRARRPADGLLHPVVLASLVVLIVNDQLAKAAWPGFVTGKLSDIAGLVVAPIAVQAAWEVVLWGAGRWRGPSERALLTSIVAVGVAFTAIQLLPGASDAYRSGLGVVQWPVRAALAILAGVPVPPVSTVVSTADAEDLLALPALLVSWWLGRDRVRVAARPPA